MMQVYEAILEVTTGCPIDNCILEDLQGFDIATPPEVILDGARYYIFLGQLVKMMEGVGITDFSSRDLTKPEADRVRRVLSAIINYIKFREVNQGAFYQELEKMGGLSSMLSDAENENKMLSDELESLEQRKVEQGPKIEETKVANEKLALELEELKRTEVAITRTKDELTNERKENDERLRQLGALLAERRQELEHLRLQRVDVPETLEQDLVELPQSIQRLMQQTDQQRKQVQSRFAAVERIESIPKDLRQVLEMMQDTAQLLERLQEEQAQVENTRLLLERQKLKASNIKTKLEQTDRLMKRTEDNMKKLKVTVQEKKEQMDKAEQEQSKLFREAQENLLTSRQLLEEKKRRHQALWQREEKYAAEVTADMEQLKRQTEIYMTEITQALRDTTGE
ncbi:kinetochore-associated Ndc80 complex subunit nuf2 [Podila epigama]|nr:kinetochore-associated Ndc80 complex subunit nuf2 [Podila epigama]